MDLSVEIAGIKLKNPVMGASGTFGYGLEWESFFHLSEIGAVVTKGLSVNPKQGNKTPRICETPSGMLNAIGLQNIGIERFLTEKLPKLSEFDIPVIANFFGNTVEEYGKAALMLTDERISALEINISCPNVKEGGIVFGTDPHLASKVVKTVKSHTNLPVIAKLSPNVTDITVMARAVEDAGADAISLINTITGMAIDIKTKKPKLANITGGLSGPAIKPIALRMVWQVANSVDVPVIGIGGIVSGEDALEFIIAGAMAVQVGAGNFVNPRCLIEVRDGIEEYLKEHKTTLDDLRGSLNTSHEEGME